MRAEVVIGGSAVLVAVWLVSLAIWPHTSCRACGGSGRNKGSNSRRYGKCWRCGGKPERLRFGARWVRRGLK